MKNAAVNICVEAFMWTHVFSFLKCIPKSKVARSYGNSMFNFLRPCQTVFENGRTTYMPTSKSGFNFSTSLLICVIVSLFDHSNTDGHEVVPRCGSHLHFPDG